MVDVKARNGIIRQEREGLNVHLVVDDDLSGLGQVAEEGVEPVETLGAHNVGGSKDNDSSENIKTLRFLIGSPWSQR